MRFTLAICALWLVAMVVYPPVGGGLGMYCSGAVEVAGGLLCAWRAARLQGAERVAWGLIACGILVWVSADAYWAMVLVDLPKIPVPSLSDAGYLAVVPLFFAAITILVRVRTPDVPRTLVADGVTAALAAGALSAAIVVQIVLGTVGGTTLSAAVNLAYPIGDLILLGVILAAFAMRGWSFDRTWALLGSAVGCFWVADTLYLLATADGSYRFPSIFDVGWTASMVLFAAAAWQPVPVAVPRRRRRASMREIALPQLFGLVSLGLLVAASFTTISPLAVLFAAASLISVMVRLGMTFDENLSMLRLSRNEALTDPLTGLRNRRALMLDLERRIPRADDGHPLFLVLFDLNGFKSYNDSFGHLAGDDLLKRLSAKLTLCLSGTRSRPYRMGGDEFCALIEPGSDVAQVIIQAAAEALSESGQEFEISCSYGSVVLPRETHDVSIALSLADQRMYAHKPSARASAGRRAHGFSDEGDAETHKPTAKVAWLAQRLALRLGLISGAISQVRRAAELHDVLIDEDTNPLSGELDGNGPSRPSLAREDLIDGAPIFGTLASFARSSHERYDGSGYPDGLKGDEIPLGSRIVAVCTAFDRMTSAGPYRPAMTAGEAITALRRGSHTQFDPDIVEVFCAMWGEIDASRFSESQVQILAGRRSPV